MRLPPIPFTVLDTETTGFVPRVHRVIEFASMRSVDGKVVDTYEQLLRVDTEIPPHVQVLTRIRPEALMKEPTMEEKRAEIIEHIGSDTLLVGQNLAYDIGMLKGEGIDLSERPWVDTSLLASIVFPEFRSYSLAYMSASLSLSHEPAHRALGDVRATLELLGHIWERLLLLPIKDLALAKSVMERSMPGYRMLFEALPATKTQTIAPWMNSPSRSCEIATKNVLAIAAPLKNTVQLCEEGLHPDTLQCVINAAAADAKTVQWIAVKNLEHALSRLSLPHNLTVIHPPWLLLNPEAATALAAQEKFSAEESTLTLKLAWFPARTRHDIALHGGEKDLWNGKIACTDLAPAYTEQFEKNAPVFLLDHRQLLSFIRDPAHAAHGLLTSDAHIIIDDASMLEDTATKAFGHDVSVEELRAASLNDPSLMQFTDLLALWLEKVRASEDMHPLTAVDLDRPETKGLRAQVEELLQRSDIPEKTREQLLHVRALLEKKILDGNLVWIEVWSNGNVFMHAAPEYVGPLLHEYLYSRFRTTMLIPQGGQAGFTETVPQKTKTVATTFSVLDCPVTVSFPEAQSLLTFLTKPPTGKSIVLAGSKRTIEQMFIAHTEALESKNVTLICQGFSGGQGRMESEFLAAEGSVILMMTPWMYEGTELPAGSADRLVLESLPFDHPHQMVYSKRFDHTRNGFESYAMPRVEARLFRLLRTFCRQRKPDGDVLILDKRLHEKAYGRRIQQYLATFGTGEATTPKTRAKKESAQLPLF